MNIALRHVPNAATNIFKPTRWSAGWFSPALRPEGWRTASGGRSVARSCPGSGDTEVMEVMQVMQVVEVMDDIEVVEVVEVIELTEFMEVKLEVMKDMEVMNAMKVRKVIDAI